MDPVDGQVAAYNDGDIGHFLSCYTPEILIEDGQGNLIMEGHEGMRAAYERFFAENPDLHCRLLSRIRVGDYVIDEKDVTGFSREDAPEKLHAVAIYRVIDGKIAHVRFLP